MPERRAVPRVEPAKPLKAKIRNSLAARVVDISERGAQLEVTSSLRPHTACDLRIRLGDGELVLRATVRRCRAWGFGLDDRDQKALFYRAGVEFDAMDAGTLARLKSEVLDGSIAIGVAGLLELPQPTHAQTVAQPVKEARPEPPAAVESGETTPAAVSAAAEPAADEDDGVDILFVDDKVPGLGPPPKTARPRGKVKIRIKSHGLRRFFHSSDEEN
jgi:hypothetical protein